MNHPAGRPLGWVEGVEGVTGFPILDRIIEAEADETRDSLLEVLGDSTFTAEYVATTLTDAGHAVSASTIRHFRRTLRSARD